jgi:hypothetical protein
VIITRLTGIPQDRPRERSAGLGRCSHPHEQRDEHQEGIAEQSDETEHQRQPLTDVGRDLGGPHVVHPHGQHGAQSPPAVHRKARDDIEDGQGDVHPQELRQEIAADPLDVAPRRRCHDTGEQRGQGHVDRRARQRDDQLLLRVSRHPLQSRHATDWQERHVAGANAVVPGGQCMAELVEHDDGKERKDEHDARPRVGQMVTLEIVAYADPGKQDQKCPVHVDVDPRHLAKLPRPSGHARQPPRTMIVSGFRSPAPSRATTESATRYRLETMCPPRRLSRAPDTSFPPASRSPSN